MKYPKKWVEVIGPTTVLPVETLDRLRAVGALRGFPEPRDPGEWWICEGCKTVEDYKKSAHCTCALTHVREVIENE